MAGCSGVHVGVVAVWGNPAQWRLTDYYVEVGRSLLRRSVRTYPARSFSTTFAVADVLANQVPGVCAVSVLALMPDTLYTAGLAASGGVEETLRRLCGSIPSSSCRAPRFRVVAESLNTLLQVLDDKAEEYSKQLGYGERVLEAMQSLVRQKTKGYRHGELHVQGTRVDSRIYLDVDAYPLLVTQPVLEKSGKRYLVMHSVRETRRRLFFEWMRGAIASRVLGFLLEAEKAQSKPIDVVIVDTTHGLNYATLAGLDAARTATALYALAQRASGRREDVVLEVVNSDPYPILPKEAQEEAKKTGWSLKVHIVTRQAMTLQAVYSILSSAYSHVDEIDSYLETLLPDQPARRLLTSATAAAAAGAAAWTIAAAKLASSLLDRLGHSAHPAKMHRLALTNSLDITISQEQGKDGQEYTKAKITYLEHVEEEPEQLLLTLPLQASLHTSATIASQLASAIDADITLADKEQNNPHMETIEITVRPASKNKEVIKELLPEPGATILLNELRDKEEYIRRGRRPPQRRLDERNFYAHAGLPSGIGNIRIDQENIEERIHVPRDKLVTIAEYLYKLATSHNA
ncbi:CRISPR-associated DxTHG motif protein [Pyrodictium abyssi]|uniref:CRISPR system endoribonuclease Csx1 CARF domain-containing protein n=1 Tax=Pyrodictium abyssi TaxID=54256 RepID=A0ABM8IVW2_9CREN|nr:hypothetical protein PABY_12710 [Pyrodictium abyssi]